MSIFPLMIRSSPERKGTGAGSNGAWPLSPNHHRWQGTLPRRSRCSLPLIDGWSSENSGKQPVLIGLQYTAASEGFPAWRERNWKERTGLSRKLQISSTHKNSSLLRSLPLSPVRTGTRLLQKYGKRSICSAIMRRSTKNIRVMLLPPSLKAWESRPEHHAAVRGLGGHLPVQFPAFPCHRYGGSRADHRKYHRTQTYQHCALFRLETVAAISAAGVPPDAIQYVTGSGAQFGGIVTAHPDIPRYRIPGSRASGVWLNRTFTARQRYIKPVILEMGSKNRVIVTRHADLDKAVEGVLKSAFGFSGQKCSAASRVYVDESVAERFIARLPESGRRALLRAIRGRRRHSPAR